MLLNWDEPTVPIVQPELSIEQSNSQIVSLADHKWLEETNPIAEMMDVDVRIRISWHPSRRFFLEVQHQWELWIGYPRWR